MTIDTQIKINKDQRLKRFIRENPIWYKYLNRNPDNFKAFFNDMKDKYKLNTSDKISKTMDNLSMIQAFLDVFK